MKKKLFICAIAMFASIVINAQCFKSISASTYHSAGIKSDGTLWAWGYNGFGQLGTGSRNDSNVPVQVGNATNWQQITLNTFTTLGIQTDGTLWAWGSNANGLFGTGDNNESTVPIRVGNATDWKQISVSYLHCLAIKADGTLWAWGNNDFGQLGTGNNDASNVPVQAGTATDWKQVSVGSYHSLAIKNDGTLWAWGWNKVGQLGTKSVIDSINTPVQVGNATGWKQVSASDQYSLAIKTDGTLWAWGDNYYGQLGTGNNSASDVPVQVGNATDWKQVSVGDYYSLAIKTDGTLWAWGKNDNGQLGINSTTNSNIPVQVGNATDWIATDGGGYSSLGLKADGALWAWGGNYQGQLGDGTTNNQLAPKLIQAGCPSVFARVKALLKGPLSGTTMSTTLNTNNLIPIAQPYSGAPWNYTGTSTESVTAIPANVTDWVLVELRDATTPATVLATRAAFIKNDGNIVDVDGVSPVEFKNTAAGNYHIAIKHRNHLAIRTAAAQALGTTASGATLYDFTTAQTQANGANPMVQSGTVYAMWSGDVNSDGNVYNTASPQDASQVVNGVANRTGNTFHLPSYGGYKSVYNVLDVNMDGNVFNTATPQDASNIVNNVANAPGNTFHLPSYSGLKAKL